MTSAAIDTLRYARRLKGAGIAPEQAEAMSEALSAELVQNLVTKPDLDTSTAELKADMAALETTVAEFKSELKADMAALETRLTWRLLSGITIIIGLAVALIRLT